MMHKDNEFSKRILVGVAGGSAAGKTTLCKAIKNEMAYDGDFNLTLISLDNFYFGIDKTKVSLKDYNWDHPDALDFDEAYKVLHSLLEGKPTKIPRYSFLQNKREDEWETVIPNEVIFFEGLFSLYDRRIRNLMNYKIFIHCDDDIRLCRRILRDVNERGFVVEGVLYQYNRFVKPAYDNYIKSTMNYADIIVPGSRHNQHLKNITNQLNNFKQQISNDIVFFGDILHQYLQVDQKFIIPQVLSEKELAFHKKILFPHYNKQKKLLTNLFDDFIMDIQVAGPEKMSKILRKLLKKGLLFLKKTIEIEKLKKEIFQFYRKKEGVEFEVLETTKILLINVNFLLHLKEEDKDIDQWSEFKVLINNLNERYPTLSIVVTNMFSTIDQIQQIQNGFKNILYFNNIFIVGNQKKLVKKLKKIVMHEYFREVINIDFKVDMFERVIEKSLFKLDNLD